MTQAVVPENSARNTEGLRPWKPGQSGNPNGRPKKEHALRDIVRNIPKAQKAAIVKVAVQCALDGDVNWATWLLKAEGIPPETTIGAMREIIIREYAGWPEQVE